MTLDEVPDGGTISTDKGVAIVASEDVLPFGIWSPEFSDFGLESPHPVSYQSKSYPTALHLFEAMRYLPDRPHIAEFIRTCHVEDLGFRTTSQYRIWQRQDWDEVAVEKLEEVLLDKFTQHTQLKELLLEQTGNTQLRYDNPNMFLGSVWGGGGDNELGKALMRLRKRFRKEGGEGLSSGAPQG